MKIPTMWNGVLYESLTSAARANSVTLNCMRGRIHKGYNCDADLNQHDKYVTRPEHNRPKPTMWNDIEFASITDAARHFGVTNHAIRYRRRKGYTCDEDFINKTISKQFSWNGISYNSIREAARMLNTSVTNIRHRINKGYTCDADVSKRG